MFRNVAFSLTLVVLAAAFPVNAAVRTWTGATDNRWSVAGNWAGGLAPVDGDELLFPDSGLNRTMVNDLAGLDLLSVYFSANAGAPYSVTGTGVTLAAGGLQTSSTATTWGLPTTLAANQMFSGSSTLTVSGPIALNGHTLQLDGGMTISGSLSGTGNVNWTFGFGTFSGTSTFTGTFRVVRSVHVTGTIAGSTLQIEPLGALSGSGTVPVTTMTNARLAPGSLDAIGSTAVLTTGSLSMTGGDLYIDVNGPVAGTNYDQVAVNGTVTLASPALTLFPAGPVPLAGTAFTIIANDGSDAVNGTFAGLAEGALITSGGATYRISYVGGTGNDVVLTVQASTKSWLGTVSNLWSVGANWSDGVAPADGDSLVFPEGSLNRNMVNDIVGLDLGGVAFTHTNNFIAYALTGNALTLSGGIDADSPPVTWNVPTTLTAAQTFSGSRPVNIANTVNLNGHTLTISGPLTISGTLTGTGAVNTLFIPLLSGTANFAGTITASGHTGLVVTGTVAGTDLLLIGTFPALIGTGVVDDTFLSGAQLIPGPELGGTATLTTGDLGLDEGTIRLDYNGPLAGTQRDLVVVNGTLILGDSTLTLNLTGPPPAPGTSFVILANDGSDPVSGTFLNLPEGAQFTAGSTPFRISYAGGDGNDVALTALSATSISLGASPNPAVAGQPITLTATVTSTGGTPTSGTVRFHRTSVSPLATATVVNGVATTTVQLPAGEPHLYAVYEGGGSFAASAPSNELAIDVLARLAIDDATAAVGSAPSTVTVTVRLLEPSTDVVTVGYATADGTATAGQDYVATSGTLTFNPGQTSRTIEVTILGDTAAELPETFRVLLSNPQNAAIEDGEAVVTLTHTAAIPSAGTVGLLLLAMILAVAGVFVMRPA